MIEKKASKNGPSKEIDISGERECEKEGGKAKQRRRLCGRGSEKLGQVSR